MPSCGFCRLNPCLVFLMRYRLRFRGLFGLPSPCRATNRPYSFKRFVMSAASRVCASQEHVIVLVHSKFSGKKTIFLDGKSEFREQKVRA